MANRLFSYNPQLKFIFIVRDPIERITSHYAHRKLRNRISSSIDEEIISKPEYLDRSRYYFQISPYIDLFGVDQILTLTLDEYTQSTSSVANRIAFFLGISPKKLPKTVFASNASLHKKVSTKNWDKLKKRWLVNILPHRIKILIKSKWFSNELRQKDLPSIDSCKFIKEALAEDITQFEKTFNINVWKENIE